MTLKYLHFGKAFVKIIRFWKKSFMYFVQKSINFLQKKAQWSSADYEFCAEMPFNYTELRLCNKLWPDLTKGIYLQSIKLFLCLPEV